MSEVITNEKTDRLRASVRAEMQQHDLSQSTVSKSIGLDRKGSSKLSQWLNDTYTGDNESINEQVELWLSTRRDQASATQEMPQAPAWVKTATGSKIHDTLVYAQIAGVSSCIYGGAGVGKTATCEHYQQTHNNVWIVTASPAASTYPACLKRIAASLGLRLAITRSAELEDEIILRLKGTHGLLVIDEAQLLSADTLWGIKHLFDSAKIGVAYVGSEQIYSNLVGRKSEMNAPLFRRISKKQRLKQPSREDVSLLLAAWGITDKASVDLGAKIAARPGALGMLTEVLRLAGFLAASDNKVVDFKFIKTAYQDLSQE